MLKNQELAKHVLESITLAQQAAMELIQAIENGNDALAETIADNIKELLLELFQTGKQLSTEEPILNLDNYCDTLIDSLERSLRFIIDNREKVLHKIEFEFFPLLQDVYLHFYFWGCVYPDPERMKYYYEHEKKVLIANLYIEEAEKSGKYKYDVSILVPAYNKLDYTKQCIESILKTVPKSINYELILINNGSTDGTKEYFESISPTKQIDIKINSIRGLTAYRIIEGEYTIVISNDIIVTENAIENMLHCIKSDPQIGWAVPTTSAISNLQEVPLYYSNMDEMLSAAAYNNHYDPFRHEQRTRLCNPVHIWRSSTAFSKVGVLGHFFTDPRNYFSYPDDVLSMLFRRNGYKNVLVKDAYCYHFGTVTHRDAMNVESQQETYAQGRQHFIDQFGVDPWDIGSCYDPNMVQLVELLPFEQINILGINSGLGSNPLKIKELYKEEQHKLNTTVYNVTDQQTYIDDLRGVSDYIKFIKNINCIFKISDENFPNTFHHIIINAPPYPVHLRQKLIAYHKLIMNYKLIIDCIDHLDTDGSLYVNCEKKIIKLLMRVLFPRSSFSANWIKIKK
ncbi:MAG: glycosyltransferase [Firmicutes bacterium]|nr:glycosyltransferase [Bacillota bacterium]